MKKLLPIIGLALICLYYSCYKAPIPTKKYKTEKVIVIVMDGARYSETWGDVAKTYIPNLGTTIANSGCVNSNFYNNGPTYTSPGHLAMISGQYYNLNNAGNELPPFPTIFQYFNEAYPLKSSWIISSKDKLEVLTNTSDSTYNNLYLANTDCGNNGLGTGYRKDSITLYKALTIFQNSAPELTLINFREPDFTGHGNDWPGYLNEINKVDSLINEVFVFVNSNPNYKDKTTLFITNDHGRHDDRNGGFNNHGDSCIGCKQLMFFAIGPDFRKNTLLSSPNELIDIAPTVAELLEFDLPNSNGNVMTNLFEN